MCFPPSLMRMASIVGKSAGGTQTTLDRSDVKSGERVGWRPWMGIEGEKFSVDQFDPEVLENRKDIGDDCREKK